MISLQEENEFSKVFTLNYLATRQAFGDSIADYKEKVNRESI